MLVNVPVIFWGERGAELEGREGGREGEKKSEGKGEKYGETREYKENRKEMGLGFEKDVKTEGW